MIVLGRIVLAIVLLLSIGDCAFVVSRDCKDSEYPVWKLASASHMAPYVERTATLCWLWTPLEQKEVEDIFTRAFKKVDLTRGELDKVNKNAQGADQDIKTAASFLFNDGDHADVVTRLTTLMETNQLQSNDPNTPADKEPVRGDKLGPQDIVSSYIRRCGYEIARLTYPFLSIGYILLCGSLLSARQPPETRTVSR